MLKRCEVIISSDFSEFFLDFYKEFYPDYTINKYVAGYSDWYIFWADDEFMVLAKLKFTFDVLSPWGTDINFAN